MANLFFVVFLVQAVLVSCSENQDRPEVKAFFATKVKQESVDSFNNKFNDSDRLALANICYDVGEKPTGFLVGSSFPEYQKTLQEPFIATYAGQDPRAVTVFKQLPSGEALERGEEARFIHHRSKKRMPIGAAFLLGDKHRHLCCDIAANTVRKETASGTEHVIEVDAKTYNDMVYLPPHAKKAFKKTYVVLNRTFTQKLQCIGFYCLLGGIAGGLGGFAIGGVQGLPGKVDDILGDQAPRLITAGLLGAYTAVQKSPQLSTVYNKADTGLNDVWNTYQHQTEQGSYFHDGHRQLDDTYNLKQGSLVDVTIKTKELIETTVTDFKKIPKVERKKIGKGAVTHMLKEGVEVIRHDPRSFNFQDGLKGARIGGLGGVVGGACYGCYKALQPLEKQKIGKLHAGKDKKQPKMVKAEDQEMKKFAQKFVKKDKILRKSDT